MVERVDTVVLGAGISGLSYAHARGPDADLLVLESSARAGGLMATAELAGGHVETGPEALQDNAPETLTLFEELGLSGVPADAAARRRFIVQPGRGALPHQLVPLPHSPGSLIGSRLLTAGGKLSLLRGAFSRRGPLDGSLAAFVRGRFGAQVLARLVDPAVSGICAGNPETLSFAAALPVLHDMLSEHGSLVSALRAKGRARRARGESRPPPPSLLSLEGGLGVLVAALARSLGDRLITDAPAQSLSRDGQGWTVHAAGRSVSARRVVLAVPVAAAAHLLQADGRLSQCLGSMVSESVISMAHVWQRDQLGHALDGFGYLVPSSLGRSHLGTLFSSSIQPGRVPAGRVLLRTLLGGARRPELLQSSDEELLSLVTREVGPLLGAEPGATPLAHAITRWPGALPRYDLDQPARQATIDALLAERPGLHIVGNHRKGISVNALVSGSRALAREHTSTLS